MTEALTPPRQLLLSRQLWIASALVGLVAAVVQVSDRRGLDDMMTKLAPQLPMAQLDSAVTIGVAMAVVFRLGIVALFWWLATRTAQGVESARLILTLLGGASLGMHLLGLSGLFTGAADAAVAQIGLIGITLSLVIFVLDAAAMAMLLHPTSRAYFIGVRRTRPGNTPA